MGVIMTQGVTPVSRDVYGLHMDIGWCVAIGVVVFGVMFYTMIAHRKANGAKVANFHESTTLEIIWTVIPFLILIIMAIPATKSLINLYDTEESELDILDYWPPVKMEVRLRWNRMSVSSVISVRPWHKSITSNPKVQIIY